MKPSVSDRKIELQLPEQNELAQYQRAEAARGVRLSPACMLAVALFFLFWGSLFFTVPYNEWSFSPAWILDHVRQQFRNFYLFLGGRFPSYSIHISQLLGVLLVGAALATTGAVFQGSFRNVLAGPSTMGVMAGGSMGCLLYVLFFTESTITAVNVTADLTEYYSRSFFETYTQQLCVLLGCFAAVALVLLVALAAGRGRVSSSAMILSGTVLSTLTSNAMMVVQYYIIAKDPLDSRIDAIADLMMGSFDNITTILDVVLMAVPIGACLVICLAVSGRLNLLSLGEEEATAMGLNVRRYRYLMIIVGTVLTAVVVAFCGHIGFLGFMIPLVGRKLAGPDMRKLLPCSMLLGAVLMLLVYDVAYITNLTGYLNLFTSSIGSIVMVITIFGRKGGGGNAAYQTTGQARMGF